MNDPGWGRISWLSGVYAICRLDPGAPLPSPSGEFFSVTRTAEELSLVCGPKDAPPGSRIEADWRVMKVQGPIPFSATGVLASLASALSEAEVSIFSVSTFDTDYLLVRVRDAARAQNALEAAGFSFGGEASG